MRSPFTQGNIKETTQCCKSKATLDKQKCNYTDDAQCQRSIMYSTCTRPDLNFVVSKLSQSFIKPIEEQRITVKHILRYLKDGLQEV